MLIREIISPLFSKEKEKRLRNKPFLFIIGGE